MDYSCYISFDLTGLNDGSTWTVQANDPEHGIWQTNPPASVKAGQSYGESIALGTSKDVDTQSKARLADLKGKEGSSGSLVLTGPLQSNQEPVTVTCTFNCPTFLENNQANVRLTNNIAGAYSATYYCCSGTPASDNQYIHGNENSGHPYYIIIALSSVV